MSSKKLFEIELKKINKKTVLELISISFNGSNNSIIPE